VARGRRVGTGKNYHSCWNDRMFCKKPWTIPQDLSRTDIHFWSHICCKPSTRCPKVTSFDGRKLYSAHLDTHTLVPITHFILAQTFAAPDWGSCASPQTFSLMSHTGIRHLQIIPQNSCPQFWEIRKEHNSKGAQTLSPHSAAPEWRSCASPSPPSPAQLPPAAPAAAAPWCGTPPAARPLLRTGHAAPSGSRPTQQRPAISADQLKFC
jgi:hypothetical protein